MGRSPCFFFNDTATTEIYTLSLHDALPISPAMAIVLLAVAWVTAGGVAVRSVSRIWLRHWAERRLSGGGAATIYLERPQRLLASAGLGVAIILLIGGMILGSEASPAAMVA